MSTGKKTATPAAGSETTTDTKKEPGGTAALVTDPLDLWYLCEKVGYALNNPKIRSDGQPMYQRVVTQLIRLDDEMFSYHFPYIGEVGYDMTQNPPKPVMSRMRPNYPSTFPLSKYAAIKKGHQWRVRGLAGSDIAVELVSELMSLEELESTLTPEMRQSAGKAKPLPDELENMLKKRRRGMLRIPDVVRLKNRMLIGKQAFSQSNLHTVIEIKFPGDRLDPEQQLAYERIAGIRKNFRLLKTDTCQVDDKAKREWLRDAKKEPVYLPVGLAGARNRLCQRPEIEAYPLLEGLIAREHQQVKDYFVPYYPPLNAGPRLEPMPDPALAAAQEQKRRQARAQLELALGGPFFAISAGAAVGGVATAASGGEGLLLGRAAGQVVSYVSNMLAGGAAAVSDAGERQTLPVQRHLEHLSGWAHRTSAF
ncbi:VRR-NUC domain-containing protein [Brenneria populi subsp. brevivirga]|uniref:VRR-NUC domain-containing protein n=1 Tax=Brenneria populi TaxID=1505588 RepID=UPI002E199313|nr:VRR-NUC domain-containing protein [Brenneria populi subsp. brevivirga]